MRRCCGSGMLPSVVTIISCYCLVSHQFIDVAGFTNPSSSTTKITKEKLHQKSVLFEKESSLFDKIPSIPSIPSIPNLPNPFSKLEPSASSLPSGNEPKEIIPFEPTPEGLIARAKTLLEYDLGIRDASLLGSSFIWIGPTIEKPLGKIDYLAAGKFFSMRTAFPDLDYRAHDFRIDEVDPFTVRCTARVVGTMRGQLRLRTAILEPNGMQLRCPPEAISMTFDPKTGTLVKLCSGFTMDRLVGNTNGLCGVMAGATIGGSPPSEWEIYPPTTVLSRFFGRPVSQLPEVSNFLAPFPETVMVQLSKGILSANLAIDDPSLLAPSFTYCTPYIGPIRKNEFLDKYAEDEFGETEPDFSHFRVDPYDPYRVWVDVKPVAPGVEGPPQAMSFTFDDEGFCVRLTGGAVMDPSIGNTGGLTGAEGVRYAKGSATPGIATRPLPIFVGRLQKKILSPITKIDVDEYTLSANSSGPSSPQPPSSSSTASSTSETAIPPLKLPKIQPPPLDALKLSDLADSIPTPSLGGGTGGSPAAKEVKKAPTEEKSSTGKRIIEQAKIKIQQQEAKNAEAASAKLKQKQAAAEAARQKQLADQAALKERQAAEAAARKQQLEEQRIEAEKKRKEAEQQRAAQITAARQEQEKKQKAMADQKRKALEEAKKKAQEKALRQLESAKKASEQIKKPVAKAATSAPAFELPLFSAPSPPSKPDTSKAAQAEKKRQEVEAKKAEAEKKRQEVEAKRIAVAEAKKAEAEKKKQEAEAKRAAEEQRLAAIAAKKAEAEKLRLEAAAKRQALAEKKKQEAEAKKKEAEAKKEALAEARRQQAAKRQEEIEKKRQLAQQKRAEAEEKRKQAAQARAQKAVRPTKPITPKKEQEAAASPWSIFSQTSPAPTPPKPAVVKRPTLNIPGANKPAPSSAPAVKRPTLNIPGANKPAPSKTPAPKKKVAKAPRGVPTIVAWRKRRDGGISGKIFGSINFQDGERVETSPITTGEIDNGNVIKTESGSRYFLSDATLKDMRVDNIKAAEKDMAAAKPGATIRLTKLAKARDAQKALEAAEKSAPRRTISLSAIFGFGGDDDDNDNEPAKPATPSKNLAPKGVPTLSRWRKNPDKSITGRISGSKGFPDGERVTTSPIARGNIASSEVVTTVSGTRYYLE